MEKFLKEEQCYIDLYDLFTINHCLEIGRLYQQTYQKHKDDKEVGNETKEDKEKAFSYALNWELLYKKTSRYKEKERTINEWVERDKNDQNKYDNANEPSFYCPKCKVQTQSTGKFLIDRYDKNPSRVLFFMECPKCKKREGVYDNGEVRVTKPDLCSKCGKEVTRTSKHKGEVYTITTRCNSCSYKEVDVDDFAKSRKERDQKEAEDKKLLEKYREEFCLDDKKGKEYIEMFEAIEVAAVVHDEEASKYDNKYYAKAIQLKRTTVAEFEKILVEKVEPAKYIKFTFGQPEISRNVTVPFTTQDSNSSRLDRQSINELEQIINATVKETNWRLVKDSISYRLGYLEGRIRGYESEEDMLKLAGKEKKPEPKSKIDPEMRQKYSTHAYVQMARITGELHGKENMRKMRGNLGFSL